MKDKRIAFVLGVGSGVLLFIAIYATALLIVFLLMEIGPAFKLLGIPAFLVPLYYSVNWGQKIYERMLAKSNNHPSTTIDNQTTEDTDRH
jgi:hypothetical protein